MPELRVSHDFDCDPETFWRKCLFDADFNRELYVERLKFPEWRVLEQREEGTKIFRRVQIDPPPGKLPAAVKKVIGEKLAYVEDGVVDVATGRYTFKIIPAVMPEKMKTEGELWTDPRGPGKCTRSARVHIEVKLFMVGSLIEERIYQDTKESYETSSQFTREWLARMK